MYSVKTWAPTTRAKLLPDGGQLTPTLTAAARMFAIDLWEVDRNGYFMNNEAILPTISEGKRMQLELLLRRSTVPAQPFVFEGLLVQPFGLQSSLRWVLVAMMHDRCCRDQTGVLNHLIVLVGTPTALSCALLLLFVLLLLSDVLRRRHDDRTRAVERTLTQLHRAAQRLVHDSVDDGCEDNSKEVASLLLSSDESARATIERILSSVPHHCPPSTTVLNEHQSK